MRITVGPVSRVAVLADNDTARAIWNALPVEAHANRWGDEIYFSVPVELAEDDARDLVHIGDVAYWPPGTAVCIFWGPTPASHGQEPRAASPVNVFGHIDDGATDFGSIQTGTRIKLEQA
jgi:hypothetical protein